MIRRAVRATSVALFVAGACLFVPSANAAHTIDLDAFRCGGASPSPEAPDGEPTPSPTPAATPGERTPSPANCMPQENDVIWGNRTIRFSVRTDSSHPLRRVSLFILSEGDGIADPNGGKPLVEKVWTRNDGVRAYSTPYTWKSTELTPLNGNYKIRVDAEAYTNIIGSSTHIDTAEREHLRVDNAPVGVPAPKIVTTTVGSATISWQPAPEGDVTSFGIYRASTSSPKTKPKPASLKLVGNATGTVFRDAVGAGFHWYAIRVTRHSVVTPEQGISSPISALSGVAEVKSVEQVTKSNSTKKDGTPQRPINFRPLNAPQVSSRPAAVPDAPFAYKLPYDPDAAIKGGTKVDDGASDDPVADPRGPILPVAVGMFLVSSALAVGRMPY